MKAKTLIGAGLLGALSLASPALAHPGHGTGLMAGFVHPFTGVDHMAAMLAVGAWAATREKGKAWTAPALFMGLLVVGGLLGVRFGTFAPVEPMTALSVAALGALLLLAPFMPSRAGLAVIGGCALLHGYAHGTEVSGSLTEFFAGFAMASAILHAAGWALGRQLFGAKSARIAAGLALGATGIALTIL